MGLYKKVKVTEIGTNFFQFVFEVQEDLNRVLSGGPWLMDNQIMVLKKWGVRIEEDTEAFSKTNLWVQISNLPLHWFSKEIGRKVGSIVDKVQDVIIPQSGSREGRHLKIQVEININQPLLRGTAVKCNGTTRWLQFKYERCPDFCYNCGVIGHGEKSCNRSRREENTHQQFGIWLKARGNKMYLNGKSVVNQGYFQRLKSFS